MGWGGTIGVALISTVLGGVVACIGAQALIDLLQIGKFEGGAGCFAVSITLLGTIVGFLTGLICALAVRSDFWKAQGYAAGAIVAMAILGTVLPVVLNDNGPTLDGEQLTLQVELKGPPGWKPDRPSRAQFNRCWLQQDAADAPQEPILLKQGETRLGRRDGGWVATSRFDLKETCKPSLRPHLPGPGDRYFDRRSATAPSRPPVQGVERLGGVRLLPAEGQARAARLYLAVPRPNKVRRPPRVPG